MHDEPGPRGAGSVQRALWTGGLTLASLVAILWLVFVAERRLRVQLMESREAARHTRESLVLAIERQSRIRRYRLTGDSALLERENVARGTLTARLDSLADVVRGDSALTASVVALRSAIADWDSASARLAGNEAGLARPSPAIEQAGAERFARVRARFADLSALQGATFADRLRRSALYQNMEFGLFMLALATMAGVLVVIGRRLRRQTAAIAANRERLEAQAAELGLQVAEARTLAHELALSNADLNSVVHAVERSRELSNESRREKEEALAFLDAALSSAPVGFAFYDRELRFTRINPALAAINGAPVEAHLGRTIREMLPALADRLEPLVRGVITSGEAVRDLEIEGETPAAVGQTRHWLATYYPVSVDGRTTGAGVVLIETTSIKQLESQLRQAQKMEAVGQLAGGIAHDFNNMLAAIKSYSELVLGDTAPDDQRYADVLEIRAAADRAAALTRQLLAFSRKQLLRPELLDLNVLVTDLGKLLERVIGVEVACRTVMAPDLALIRADPSQLEQVLMNLAVNARDAMPDGGTLTITTENVILPPGSVPSQRTAGPHVHLAVADTGSGMEPWVRERIFEPFFTTKEPGKGTGLGLATVYGIVQQSGGCLTVDTRPGAGTTFHVYLPAIPVAVRQRPITPPRAVTATGTETLLLIEDDVAVLSAAARILRSQGYRVLEASTPRAAEAIASRHAGPIDLILTDLMLPEMNGRDLAVRLRVRHPAARLLYMSGYSTDAGGRGGPGDADVPFLAKPFTVEAMAAKVREALTG